MTRHDAAAIGVLGKVPWRDEYVHVLSHGEAFLGFETLLAEGMEWAAAHSGSDWPDAYRRGRIHAFVFRPEGEGKPVVVGAIAPSHDRGGRNFPLAVTWPLQATSKLCRNPEALPLELEEFWALAGRLLVEIRSAPDLDLAEKMAGVRLERGSDDEDGLSAYEAWSRSLPLAELWALVYGESGSTAALGALRVILEAVRPHVGEERPTTPLSLRLPLGSAGGAAVCFWLDLVKRAIRWRSTIPSFFWSHDGHSGDMLLHLGHPPRSTVSELWMPTGQRDEFCDVTQAIPPERARALGDLPSQLDSMHADERLTVLDLLEAIEQKA